MGELQPDSNPLDKDVQTRETTEMSRETHPVIVPTGTTLSPPRPGVRHVRVVYLGIVIADDDLRQRMHRYFHWPMIVLAFLVLPLLGIELLRHLQHQKAIEAGLLFEPHWIDAITWVGFVLIWLAFLVEFVIKIAIAECRIEYVKRNWLDIIIIAMPAFRALRLARLASTTRVFTLRGVGMKFARYLFTIIIGMEATDRILHRFGLKSKKGRKDPTKMTRDQLMDEVKKLRKLSDAWENWYAAHQEHVVLHSDHASLEQPIPTIDSETDLTGSATVSKATS